MTSSKKAPLWGLFLYLNLVSPRGKQSNRRGSDAFVEGVRKEESEVPHEEMTSGEYGELPQGFPHYENHEDPHIEGEDSKEEKNVPARDLLRLRQRRVHSEMSHGIKGEDKKSTDPKDASNKNTHEEYCARLTKENPRNHTKSVEGQGSCNYLRNDCDGLSIEQVTQYHDLSSRRGSMASLLDPTCFSTVSYGIASLCIHRSPLESWSRTV